MENFKVYNSDEYLEKNKPSKLSDELIQSIKKLTEPLADIDYENQSSAEVEKGCDTLEFSLEKPSEEVRGILSGLINDDNGSREYVEERTDLSKWQELTRFDISRKGSNQPILELTKLLPPDCKIIVFPQKDFVNACAVQSNGYRLILYIGDLSAEVVTPALLHEIGHMIDYDNLREAGRDKFVTDAKHSDEAEQLRKERTATAYALKILRPKFKDNSIIEKDCTLEFLKSYALNTYHNSIDATLRTKEAYWHNFGKHLQADEDLMWQQIEANDEYDKQLAEFEKIKQTNEYKEWRSKRPDDEEYDQMRTWDDWLKFVERKKTDEFKDWKTNPENQSIEDEEEKTKFENDMREKFFRDNKLSPFKTIKDLI